MERYEKDSVIIGETIFNNAYYHVSALFDGEVVAVKISWNDDFIKHETDVYRTLNAFNDPKIENSGIPRAYYSGPIFANYTGIVMTLFDETLEDRYSAQNGTFNAYSTLQIFKQSVYKIHKM